MTAEERAENVARWAHIISLATGIDESHAGLIRALNGFHLNVEAGIRCEVRVEELNETAAASRATEREAQYPPITESQL